jgi:hypothetical protein
MITTCEEFGQWLLDSKAGDWCMYHSGFLWVDRLSDPNLNGLAAAAWQAYLEDEVALVQKRPEVDHENCDYFMVRL